MNTKISDELIKLADLITLSGAKGPELFKIKSYKNVANLIKTFPNDISKFSKAQLLELPGVGNSIADKILEVISTGKISKSEELQKKLPPVTISEFTKLRKIGPVAAKKIWQTTGATNMKELLCLVDDGKITDEDLLDSIKFYKEASERVLLVEALQITEPIIESLKQFAIKIEQTGSIRRLKDTVHDADILVLTTIENKSIIQQEFLKFADETIVNGETKTSIYVKHFQVDLTIITNEKEFGAALFHATGPKEYNVKNRIIAKNNNWLLNDKGLWNNEVQLDNGTEENICDILKISFIKPELRELAAIIDCENLPYISVNHDLHVHTNFSDGHNSPEELISICDVSTIAITDHGKGLAMNGIKDLHKYFKELNSIKTVIEHDFNLVPNVKVLIGVEANVDKHGNLDYTDDELKNFDIVIASIHSNFELSREEQTNRLVTTINNKEVDIIGHPTGEDYGVRRPMDIDWNIIFSECVKNNVALEINGVPSRIGLSIELIQQAKNIGVKFTLGSDSHSYCKNATKWAKIRALRSGLTNDDFLLY